MPTPSQDYQDGYANGLSAGYKAALTDPRGLVAASESNRRHRTFFAWGTLAFGLGSAASAIYMRKDNDMFALLGVMGGVMAAVIGAVQVITDDSASGPFGLK